MSVLAIDTSARRRFVCITATADGELLHSDVRTERHVDIALPQSLMAVDVADISAVVVVVGPGSYTGVRAGMAGGLGIAHARGLPLHGVGSLDVVAAGAFAGGASAGVALADAGRGGVYVARFDASRLPTVAAPERVDCDRVQLSGSAAFAFDELAVPARRLDPAAALAAVVPMALARGAATGHNLHAVYVE